MSEHTVVASYSNRRRKTHGLTDTELEEAMQMYVDKMERDVIAAVFSDFGSPVDSEMRKVIEHFLKRGIDKAFNEGMKLAGDTLLLPEFYKEAKNRTAESLTTQYEFVEGLGVGGVLFPDGTFQKCGNAEHYLLMTDIPMDVQTKCLYFSSMRRGDGEGLVTNSPVGFEGITGAQLFWLKEHFQYLDRGQKRNAGALRLGVGE